MESITDWAFSWPISEMNKIFSFGRQSRDGMDWRRGEGGRTLVVIDYISEVVSAAVVCFSDAHGVVGEVDIAVVT